MLDEKTYPFDDEYMVFDKLTGQYVITEEEKENFEIVHWHWVNEENLNSIKK